ncbi:hypothetical protein FB451DRAFT_1169650 [Mycena latifolia]|nr:hypothetical protein FB451DRAFT_1169650 [Mycena latifolia]
MSPRVIPQALPNLMARAKDLRTLCEKTPGMNSYQPIAASTVELKMHKAETLAAYTVDLAAILVNSMAHIPISPDILQSLEIFERCQQEGESVPWLPQVPKRNKSPPGRIAVEKCLYELASSRHLLQLAIAGLISESTGKSHSECVQELVSMSIRVTGAICEAPVLNFLKPVVGIAALICETAKSVQSNHAAAADLARQRAIALEDIQSYLAFLKKPRRRLAPWIFANQEKDRFNQLGCALERG